MGSVKDLLVTEPAYEDRPGVGTFVFSDRYSVFDWGEMPDHLSGKGRALAAMAAFNFEELERRGFRTHYRGLVADDGRILRFDELQEGGGGSAVMQVALARVYRPEVREYFGAGVPEIRYDYSFFESNRGRINNYLIGLEIIFRNGLPLGSSMLKRLEEARATGDPRARARAVKALLREMGVKQEPKAGDMLPRPVMSFTTKLEPGDRHLSEAEARQLSGLRGRDFQDLKDLALNANQAVCELAEKAGFRHYDGKIEAAWEQGLVLCDVIGTFDENRFAYQGRQISKEVLRQWYKRKQPAFVAACERWKKTGPGWQKRCDVQPKRLPRPLATLVSQMYLAGANRYTGRRIFKVPELDVVLDKLEKYRE
jgi:phosphoribosylaminoimidazole-succinocarboxamide synthase